MSHETGLHEYAKRFSGNRMTSGKLHPAAATVAAAPEAAVAFTDLGRLTEFVAAVAGDSPCRRRRLLGLGGAQLEPLIDGRRVARIYFGNEFCERLLPSRASVDRAVELVRGAGLAFSLVTPMLTDRGMEAAEASLGALPAGCEVVANDWGLIRRVQRRFPTLRPTAGRLLCKILKEPRAPSAAYMKLGGHGFVSPGFKALLARLRVARVEADVPPFARAEDLRVPDTMVSVHVPFGFATTGRICRIGSLHQPLKGKFATGHNCARECLSYATLMTAAGEAHVSEMHVYQRGNTIFYRHSAAMTAALADAIAAGTVDRVVISGDWNEARRSDLSA